MDKQKLNEYIEKIENFERLTEKEQILFFGYHLQHEQKFQNFKSSHIKKCFEESDTPTPSNITARMCELNKDRKILPSELNSFRLSRKESDRIKKICLSSITTRIEKVYKPGEIYEFYQDIQKITLSAQKEVFVIDAYAHEDIIDLYLAKLPIGIKIMILTSKPQGNFENIANKFKLKHTNCFKVKTNKKCHDRLFFVDKKCYVIGQSIEKAAKDQATYLCEVEKGGPFRAVFQSLYDSGKNLI